MTAINVTPHSRAWLGVVVALAAAAGYAVANTSASLAYQGGSNPLTVAATRFLVPTIALVVWLRLSGVSLVLPKRDTLLAIVLGFITALYTWALLRSFNALPFALAVLIFYLFPLIAAVIVAAFGWHKFAWRTGAAIVLALVGLALALDVRGGNLNAGGITLALLAAVGLAVVIVVSSRVIGSGDARPATLTWPRKTYLAISRPIMITSDTDASLKWCSTPPLWHIDAVGGRPPHHKSNAASVAHGCFGRKATYLPRATMCAEI